MSKHVEEWLNEIVTVLTNDGRQFVGILITHDLSTNVVLQHCHERVYKPDSAMEKVPMKTLVIRGDAVMCIGLIDEDIDSQLDPASIRGEQLNSFQF